MNDIERELTAGMRERVGKLAQGRNVLEAATVRHRRRTAARWSVYVAGVLALAGVFAAAGPWSAEPRRNVDPPPAVVAQPPDLALAAAVTASETTSYRIRVTDTWGGAHVQTREGALDPVRANGYLRSLSTDGSGPSYEDRLVEGTWYIGGTDDSSTFKQMPGRHNRLDFNDSLHGVAGASADPNELLRALAETRAKITQPAPDTYHFEIVLYDNPATRGKISVAGDVKLNADKRIASVSYETTIDGLLKDKITPYQSRSSTTIELFDYGIAVTVNRPPKVVVVTE